MLGFFISQEIIKTLNHFTHKSANNLSFSSFFLKIILCYDIMKSIYCWKKKYNVTNFKKIKLYLYICFYFLSLFFMIPYPSLSSSGRQICWSAFASCFISLLHKPTLIVSEYWWKFQNLKNIIEKWTLIIILPNQKYSEVLHEMWW